MAQPADSPLSLMLIAAVVAVAALVFAVLWRRLLRLVRLRATVLRIYELSEDVFHAGDAGGILTVLQRGLPAGLGLYPEGILAGDAGSGNLRVMAGREPDVEVQNETHPVPLEIAGRTYGVLACRKLGTAKPGPAETEAFKHLVNQVAGALHLLEQKSKCE